MAWAGLRRWGGRVRGGVAWLASVLLDLAAELVVLGLTVALLVGLGVGVLAWRLAMGPVDVSWLATRLVAASRAGTGPLAPGTRLSVRRAELGWAGYRDGLDAPLRLQVDGLRATDAAGVERARIDQLDVTSTPHRLLDGLSSGPIPLTTLAIHGLKLRLVRGADGRIALDLGETDGDGRAAAPATSEGGGTPANELFAALRRVQVSDAVLDLADKNSGVTWHVSDLDVDARRTAEGLSGRASGAVQAGAFGTRFAVDARRADDVAADTALHATLTPFPPAALAGAVPALAGLAGLDAPLELDARATLDPALRPRSAVVQARAAAGRAALPGGATLAFDGATLDASAEWADGAALPRSARLQARLSAGRGTQNGIPFTFNGADLDAEAAWAGSDALPSQVRLKAAHLMVPSPSGAAPTTVGVSGDARQASGHLDATLVVEVDQVLAADLPKLWPPDISRNARAWVTENITAGTARNARFTLGLTASRTLSDLDLTSATGSFAGENLTVHWLRPAPPATGAFGVFTLRSPAMAEIAIGRGAQGRIALRDGMVRLTGLDKARQDIAITLQAAGTLPDVLTLLRHPRLKLLSKHQLPLNDPAGQVSAKLDFAFPLKKDLDFDDVTLHVGAQLANVRLRRVVAGRDVERGQLRLDVTGQDLRLQGQAALAGVQSRLGVYADFRAGPPSQVLLHATVDGVVNERQLAAQGVDATGLLAGTAALSVTYDQRRSGRADVAVRTDLRDAAVSTPLWSKPRGAPATAEAAIVLMHDKLVSVERLHAEGPELRVDGSADLADGRLGVLRLVRAQLGRSDATGEIRLPQRPGDALGIRLSGGLLDLSPYVARQHAGSPPTPPRRTGSASSGGLSNTPFAVDIRFGQVLIGPGLTVRPLVLQAQGTGRHIQQARLEALPLARGSVVPEPGGRRLDLAVADVGTILGALDVTRALSGGLLVVGGRFDDTRPGRPLHATAELTDFKVFEAVLIGKVLQAVTLYGVLDALRGPGLAFTRAVVPFTYTEQPETLDLHDARAFSASLGVTAKGRINLGADTLDLRGTIVPAYFFNSLLGRIPYIGRVFTAERGGGLISAEAHLHGKLDDPGISVNPLTLLTPGILRRLFHITD